MRLRTTLLVGMLALLSTILIAIVATVSVVLERAAERDLAEELRHNQRVFAGMLADRQALLGAETRVVAEEPRLKAVVASEEVSKETIAGVIFELRRAAGSELLVLADPDGRSVAESGAGEAAVEKSPLIAAALKSGDANGLVRVGDRLFQLSTHRLAFGATVVGALALGQPIDAALANTFTPKTGSELAIVADGAILTGSDALVRAAPPAARLDEITDDLPRAITMGGARYLALAAPIPERGSLKARFVVLRSLDAALRPAKKLIAILVGLLAAALVASFFIAGGLARRLARPVDALAQHARRIGQGRLETATELAGPVEVRALGDAMNLMVVELADLRDKEASRQRLARELEIATRIQTSILPRDLDVRGLEISAIMVPAEEVGGDYYDVRTVDDGCWIGIGDVSGHGLPAGLVMMMVQSIVAGVVAQMPGVSPSAALSTLNRVLWSNIRQRLSQDDHVTLSLMRYHARRGELVFAGAHEDILVWRAATGAVEQIATPGTWVGGMRDVEPYTVDTILSLEIGDVVLLYTDGVTEALDSGRKQFGIERLAEALTNHAKRGPTELRDAILREVRAFSPKQFDDITIVVLRYDGLPH